ncbi:MAG: MBL fold metallo-hydrolase [Candidatus Aminicenantes bacterium]|jgi:glyoxylase-like metal-dependent hydrolase (beta-lactamase superfamily II)
MKEVYPGIFRLVEKGALRNLKPPENIYVFAGHDGLICDAGYGNRKTVKKLIQDIQKVEELYKKQGKAFRITRVLVSHSHPDHFSGLRLLRKKLGVRVVLTQKIAEVVRDKKSFLKTHFASPEDLMQSRSFAIKDFWARIHNIFRALFFTSLFGLSFLKNPDEQIEENSEISINGEIWRIFPSPGHASDHISLYHEEKGVLFAGDNILRRITTWLGPPDSNLSDYIQSLEYMTGLPNLRIILSSHGGPIFNPQKRIKEILDHRLRRTQQIKEIIKKRDKEGITPTEIIKELYPNVRKMKQELARGWVVLTLEYLEEKNQIRRTTGKKGIKFFPA